jgi:hypothetical protein
LRRTDLDGFKRVPDQILDAIVGHSHISEFKISADNCDITGQQ